MNKKLIYYVCFFLPGILLSCGNEPFLTTPTDINNHTPRTLDDLQQVLDNEEVMNGTVQQSGPIPSLLVSGTDEITVSGLIQTRLTAQDIQQYTWGDDPFGSEACPDWDSPYRVIAYANVILDGLAELDEKEQENPQGRALKGGALFHRAFMHYSLAQIFAPPYSSAKAAYAWGIPLRFLADVNEPIKRASVQETYESILQDLHQAITLLPDTTYYKTRPSKAAALALLARVYQTMGHHDKALDATNNCLAINDRLLDYQAVSKPLKGSLVFSKQNPEILFFANLLQSILHSVVNTETIADY